MCAYVASCALLKQSERTVHSHATIVQFASHDGGGTLSTTVTSTQMQTPWLSLLWHHLVHS